MLASKVGHMTAEEAHFLVFDCDVFSSSLLSSSSLFVGLREECWNQSH
jgi:hypothetical protein